jgi:hypothetical protein
MLRSGLLIAACLATGLSASAQQSGRARLDPAYQGVFAVNGTCEPQEAFIFGETFVERASDACRIDKVQSHGEGVRVVVTCWHELESVGQSTYDMVRNTDGTLTLSGWPNKRIKRCGPVPQVVIDAYTRGDN